MKSILNSFDLTVEAQRVLSDFVSRLTSHASAKSADADSVEDLRSSLAEHIIVVLRDICDRKGVAVVDAQLMLEVLLPLGTPEELIDALDPSDEKVKSKDSEDKSTQDTASGKIHREYIFPSPKILKRSKKDRWLLGVCGGFAEYWGISSLLLRFLMIFSGIGPLAYIIIGLIMPPDDYPEKFPTSERSWIVSKTGSFLKIAFICFMIVCLYLPMSMMLLGVATGGFFKILNEIGLTGQTSGDLWSYFVIGLPGYLAGFCGLVSGIGLFVLLTQFFASTFFNKSIVNFNTRRLMTVVSVTGIIFLGILWFSSLSVKSHAFKEKATHEFESAKVRSLDFSFPAGKVPYYSKSVQIIGDPQATAIKVEVNRKVGGWSEEKAIKNFDSLGYVCKLSDNGKLELGGNIGVPAWWLYPYPEISFLIVVPQNHALEVICNKNRGFRGDMEISKLTGPVNVDVDIGRILVNSVISSEINVESDVGNIEFQDVLAGRLSARTEVGKIECTGLTSGQASFESEVGSIGVSHADCDEIKVSSKVGSVSLSAFSAGKVNLNTKTGSIRVETDRIRSNSEFTITSEVGSIRLKLPEDSNPDLICTSNIGRVHNEFEGVKSAPGAAKIRLKSSVGSIRISKGKSRELENHDKILPAEAPERDAVEAVEQK